MFGVVLVAAVSCKEAPVPGILLLSEPVTFGDKPLVIVPDESVPATGPLFWTIIQFPAGTPCSKALLASDGQPIRLKVSVVASNGRSYPLQPGLCGANDYISFETEVTASKERMLRRVELSASAPVRIAAVSWRWKDFELGPR